MPLKLKSNLLLAGICAAALSGCSADDVQLNGKVFDALGVNTSSVERKAPDMKARSGIVIPPNLSSLPPPSAEKTDGPDIAEIQDYDAKRAKPQQILEKEQAEYCAKHYDMARAMGNQDEALVEGPLGRCQKSILSLTGINGSGGKDDAQ